MIDLVVGVVLLPWVVPCWLSLLLMGAQVGEVSSFSIVETRSFSSTALSGVVVLVLLESWSWWTRCLRHIEAGRLKVGVGCWNIRPLHLEVGP